MAPLRRLAEGLDFPEGPTLDRAGHLFVVETGGGRIARIEDDGSRVVHAAPGGGPNGLALGQDGGMFCANSGGFVWDGDVPDFSRGHDHGRIEYVAPDGGVQELYTHCDGEPLDAPDDITVDGDGWIWFTDPGHQDWATPAGRVFVAAPDGSAIRQVAGGYRVSNGIAFTADGRRLFVAETATGWIYQHEVLPDRHLGERQEWARLPRGYKPDGFCLDVEGNLIVAGTFGGALFVYAPSGHLVERLEVDDPFVTNVAFGGADFDQIFVTMGKTGRVDVTTWDHKGLPLPFGAQGPAHQAPVGEAI